MLDPKDLRRVMGHFATGVTIVTTRGADGTPYGLTANAFTSLSLDPPLCLVCVDRKAESFAHFYDSKVFTVNILTREQEDLSNRFAKSGGDKFTGVATAPGHHGAPLIAGALATIECRITATHDSGDHVIHIGHVEHVQVNGGDPLLFFQGRYRRLVEA
ncbi:MAG TPA: flavin reductase family protein [Candidatus Eisenbacteria bacterium]|nr:flavin reductase family protein [Candidatus Eisenbacteria bacterium]